MFKLNLFARQPTVTCYHCGERVALRDVVRLTFDGTQRELCCHGCEAVLLMVQNHGLVDDYVRDRINHPPVRAQA